MCRGEKKKQYDDVDIQLGSICYSNERKRVMNGIVFCIGVARYLNLKGLILGCVWFKLNSKSMSLKNDDKTCLFWPHIEVLDTFSVRKVRPFVYLQRNRVTDIFLF